MSFNATALKRTAIIAVGVVLIAGGVGSAAVAGNSRSGKKAAGKPIIIGAAIAQTSFLAPFDVPPSVGAQFAIADINAHGGVLGRPLKMIFSDTKSDRAAGATAALDVINKGAGPLIIASCDFDFSSAAVTTATGKGLLAFSECAGSTRFSSKGLGPNAFTWGIPDIVDATNGANFAYKDLHLRKAYVLEDTLIEYTKRLSRYFQTKWKKMAGAKVVGVDTFVNSDPSIASQISRLKAANPKPDFIYLASLTPGGASALRQIRAAGIKLPVVAGEGMEGVFWQKAIPRLTNFYYTAFASLVGDDPRPGVNALLKRYVKKAGQPKISSFIMGERYIYGFKAAAEAAHSLDPTAIRKQLEKFNGKVLPPGIPTYFTSLWHVDLKSPELIMKVVNGKNSYVKYGDTSNPPPVLP
jgi:branched-chain amino acid transport system substrate-binding protein